MKKTEVRVRHAFHEVVTYEAFTGYIVPCALHPAYTFVAHRWQGAWRMTETSTGRGVVFNCDTRAEAVQKGLDRLKDFSPKELNRRISASLLGEEQ